MLLLLLSRKVMLFGFKMQVTLAALGYAIFGVGVEIAGITVSKIIVKWFKGRDGSRYGTGNGDRAYKQLWPWCLPFLFGRLFGPTDESGRIPYQYSAPILFCLVMLWCRYHRILHLYFHDKKPDASLDAEGLNRKNLSA